MMTPLFVILGGLVFVTGFAAGSAFFSLLLRQRERQLRIKAKGIESARLYLRRHGIDLPAWVASAADHERHVRIIQRPRWFRRRKGGKHRG